MYDSERKWRNWKTRWVQGPVRATSWGFKSPLPHHCRDRAPTLRLVSAGALFGIARHPSAALVPYQRGLGAYDQPRRKPDGLDADRSKALTWRLSPASRWRVS